MTDFPLGSVGPSFRLPDTLSGQFMTLEEATGGKPFIVAFICNHCPFVLHVIDAFVALASDYRDKGIATIAISSNDIDAFPEDGPVEMRGFAKARGFAFPYFYDEGQEVARGYDAFCTPEFYLFDAARRLVYHGQFDSSRPTTDRRQGNAIAVTGEDLRAACDAVLAGAPLIENQKTSMGCTIKWKPETTADAVVA